MVETQNNTPTRSSAGTIPERLAEFGMTKFGHTRGWKARFAEALGFTPGALQNYLSGLRTPGHPVQQKLRALGADVEYIMSGHTTSVAPKSFLGVPIVGMIEMDADRQMQFVQFMRDTYLPYRDGRFLGVLVAAPMLVDAPQGMNSLPIHPGDICFFNLKQRPRKGDIVCLTCRGTGARVIGIAGVTVKGNVTQLHFANNFLALPVMKVQGHDTQSCGVLVAKVRLTELEAAFTAVTLMQQEAKDRTRRRVKPAKLIRPGKLEGTKS